MIKIKHPQFPGYLYVSGNCLEIFHKTFPSNIRIQIFENLYIIKKSECVEIELIC